MNDYDSTADDIFVDTKYKLCTISRPPQQAPGHISVVSSPFLLNNHVQLKVPRTTPVPKTGDIVLNIIKHVSPSPNQYEEVYPYSLKQSQNQGGDENVPRSRRKRWVPVKGPRQLPQEDSFLNSINRSPNVTPRPVRDPPKLEYIPSKMHTLMSST